MNSKFKPGDLVVLSRNVWQRPEIYGIGIYLGEGAAFRSARGDLCKVYWSGIGEKRWTYETDLEKLSEAENEQQT